MKEYNIPKRLGNNGPALCCSCTGHCFDNVKCACRKMTNSLAKMEIEIVDFSETKYTEKVLKQRKRDAKERALYSSSGKLEHLRAFGIFECNQKCACKDNKSKCLNRVAQGPINPKLQIYDTQNSNLGFGLRCSKGIAAGEFIGNYTGELIHDSEKKGKDNDYIMDLMLF